MSVTMHSDLRLDGYLHFLFCPTGGTVRKASKFSGPTATKHRSKSNDVEYLLVFNHTFYNVILFFTVKRFNVFALHFIIIVKS